MFRFYNGMQNNNISFTSKIQFVPWKTFTSKKPMQNEILYFHNTPNILKADEFYSLDIRTCTGGGLTKPSTAEAEGFHFWDDKTTQKKANDNVISLIRFVKNPERGLILGGKRLESNPLSVPLYYKFRNMIADRVKNLTEFSIHRYEDSQTHYRYDTKNDTWTICTEYRKTDKSPQRAVNSLGTLKKAFEKISIAPGDRLFIGEKEIKPQDAPELFQKKV